jgi:hypothetical protein
MGPAYATLTFADQQFSRILVNQDAGKFVMQSTAPSSITGKFVLQKQNNLNGNPLFFNNGIFSDGSADVVFTGTYDPNSTYSIILPGNGRFNALTVGSPLWQQVYVMGTNNKFEGYPAFKRANAITLADDQAAAAFAVAQPLNQNVVLSGGSVSLDADLALGNNVIFAGSGTVFFNDNNLTTGEKSLVWTDTLTFKGAKNLILGGDSYLYGQWIFDGDAHILGNNKALDLTHGATLWIKHNTTVEMDDLVIDGLGSGSIIFEDHTSQLNLYNVTFGMNKSVTFTTGGLYFDGPGKINVANHFLTIDQNASMTVDNATVYYDPIDFNDQNNVRFGPSGFDQTPRYITSIDGGSVRKADSLKVGPYKVSVNRKFDRDISVSPLRPMVVDADPIVDGDGFVCEFAISPQEPLVAIDANQLVQYINILLRNFPLSSPGLSIGAGATLILGPQTTIEMGESTVLNDTLYFDGAAVLNGRGKILELGATGALVLRPGASLLLDNITLRGVSDSQIICMDNSCTVSIGDVVWEQDDDFSFIRGGIYVKGYWDIKGTSTFGFCTIKPLEISRFGTLKFDEGMSFSYAPLIDNRDLVQCENEKSTIIVNGASLISTTTGLRLTKGTLIVDGYSSCQNPGAVAMSESIAIGNGNPADELTMIISPGATFDVLAGIMLYDQEE